MVCEGAHAEDGGEVVVEGDVVCLGAGREAGHAALRLSDGVAVEESAAACASLQQVQPGLQGGRDAHAAAAHLQGEGLAPAPEYGSGERPGEAPGKIEAAGLPGDEGKGKHGIFD